MTTHFTSGARFIACALLLLAIVRPAAAAESSWKAGAAKVNITPEKFMWMGGYGARNQPADGKLTDLWAKALVLEDGSGHRGVLVALDLLGIDRPISQRICQELEKQYQLERSQIALCSSHTHSGPVVAGNLRPLHYMQLDEPQQRLVDEYAEQFIPRVVKLVGDAIDELAPAELAWGSGRATFAVNRRNNAEAMVPSLRAEGTLGGPVDHDLPVLAVKGADGRLRSVLFGYACHSTVLNLYQWSADYPGYAQIELEQSHPGSMALFWAGCGGDQNPLPRRTVELAQEYGGRLATAVDEVLAGEMTRVGGALTTRYAEIDLPLDTLPTTEELERDAQSKERHVATRARMLLAQVNSGEPLSPTYPYPVQVWRIGGEVQLVYLGGETVVDYAVRLKQELAGTKTWVSGYANDVMAYIPSRRVLREGGYEGGGAMLYYGLPTVWAPDVEERIVEAVHAQVTSP